jgi:hypothetical protein
MKQRQPPAFVPDRIRAGRVEDVVAERRACRSGNVCGRTTQQVDGRAKATLDEHQP